MLGTLNSYPKREQVKAGALKEVDDLASLANQIALKITIWACFGQRAGPQNIVRCQMQRNLRKKFILKSAEFTQKFRQTVTVSTTNTLAYVSKSGDISGILWAMVKQKLFNTAMSHRIKMGGRY